MDCHYDGGGVLRQVSSGEGEVERGLVELDY